MTSKTETATPLTFDRFWRFMVDHPNCIVRVGTGDCTLIDHDDFHWDFLEDQDGHAVIQVVNGKSLVAELAIPRRDIMFVQSSIDVENAASGYWLFELIGGTEKENHPVAQVLMSHGMEQQQGHQMLKH